MILLASFFFAYAGLSIVIAFAFIYGDQVVKWSSTTQILMFVITQFTAAAGAFLFGIIQDKWRAKQTFILTLVLWVVAVSLIYGVSDVTAFVNSRWVLPLKRSICSLLSVPLPDWVWDQRSPHAAPWWDFFSPDTKAGEFFGLWSFTGRLSSIVGLMGLGLLQTLFGLQKAILVCSVFFFIAVVIVLFVNEERGKMGAREHAGE